MAYASTPVKPDDPSREKYFYLCQTKGCGEVINPAFPTAEKNPAPVHCKFCQVKENRATIEEEYAKIHG